MSVYDLYLYELINKKRSNGYNQTENNAFEALKNKIEIWADINDFKVEIKKSGSKEKNDAIRGKSDIDIFVSIEDKRNDFSIEYYRNSLYEYLGRHYNYIRNQDVSIGINYSGIDIDVTPGKKINSIYLNGNHYIYSREDSKRVMTNIDKQIMSIKTCMHKEEIILLKIWKSCHKIKFPSIAIELITIECFNHNYHYETSITERIKILMDYIIDNIETTKLYDPGNPNNDVLEDFSIQKRKIIKNALEEDLINIQCNPNSIKNIFK